MNAARRRHLRQGAAGLWASHAAAFGLPTALAACVALEEVDPARGGAAGQAGGAAGAPTPSGVLTPWQIITGGWRRDATLPAPGTLPPRVAGGLAGSGSRQSLVMPVGVAVRGDTFLVADAGARVLLRGQRSQDSLAPWQPYAGPGAEQGASLVLTRDLSAYVALPQQGEVQQIDARGLLVRRFRDDVAAARPVAVAVSEDRSTVYVADAQTARVVLFNPAGRVIATWGAASAGAAAPSLQSVAGLALGPDGLHVIDRQAQQVVVFGPGGRVVGAYGEGSLTRPRAVVVDDHGRSIVADEADQTLSVFWRGERIARHPQPGRSAAGRFGRIEALALDGNQLYVADAGLARVQILLVAPPSLLMPAAPAASTSTRP